MGRPKGSKNKKTLVLEALLRPLPIENSELDESTQVIFPVSEPLIVSFDKRYEPSDTKTNPNNSYYQYIQPCNLHKAQYDYRYFIVKNRESVISEPFSNIKDCHTACKKHIKEGI